MQKSRVTVCVAMLLATTLPAMAEIEQRSIPRQSGEIAFVESPQNRTSVGSMGVNAIDTLRKMEALEDELRELRGRLEQQEHAMQQLMPIKRETISQAPKLESKQNHDHDSAQEEEKSAAKPEKLSENKSIFTEVERLYAPTPAQPEGKQEINQPNPRLLYQAGYQLLQQRRYSEAEKEFVNLVKIHPKSTQAASAYYWIGEIKLLEGAIPEAIAAFETIAQDFTEHLRAPDALLKLGMIAADNGKKEEAQTHFQKIIAGYPDASSADIAARQLRKLDMNS